MTEPSEAQRSRLPELNRAETAAARARAARHAGQRSGFGTFGILFGLRGHGPPRPRAPRAAGPRRPRARRRPRPAPRRSRSSRSTRGFACAADEKRAMARLAAALVGEGESVALDSSTSAYYLALELRAQARARRRHERPPDRRRARRRARRHRAPHGRDAAPGGDVRRRRPRGRGAALDPHRQGLLRRARAQPRARADGPEPRRGALQAADGRGLRARDRPLRRDEVAAERAALVRPGRARPRDRHRRGRAGGAGRGAGASAASRSSVAEPRRGAGRASSACPTCSAHATSWGAAG